MFLHIKPERLDEMVDYLSEKLGTKAVVMKTEDAIEQGLFGTGKEAPCFRDRVGNLLILPTGANTIWYRHTIIKEEDGTEKKRKKFDLLGHHGGLSEEEMLVPFGAARLSDLI